MYRDTIYMPKMSAIEKTLALSDYRELAELRYQVRRFLHFSEQAAQQMGLEPQQHQVMLALKGLPLGIRPTIGTRAERLQLQHHSTTRKIVKSNWSWTATVSRSGTSNSTLRPRTLTYQSREAMQL